MAGFEFSETTSVPPATVLEALTDFGPGRSARFPNSSQEDLVVHDLQATSADVTEGSRGIWERLHYDWSDPADVRMTTVDSNTWGGASGHRWRLTPLPAGGTRVDVTVVREPANLRGRVFTVVLLAAGRPLIRGQIRGLLRGLEAQA